MKSLQVAGIAALALVALSSAKAQSNGVFRLPAQGGGRQAAQAKTPPPPPSSPAAYPYSPSYPRYPVAYTVLPAIIMSDGSIYANFGYGYQPVRRACAQPRILGSNDGLRGGAPTHTQPAPAQATPSQLNLPSVRAQQQRNSSERLSNERSLNACYRMDSYGPVVVLR